MNVQQKLPKPQMHRSESVDFLEPDNVPTLDVDGVANVLFNTTTVTLEFFKTIPARSTIEEERGDAQPT